MNYDLTRSELDNEFSRRRFLCPVCGKSFRIPLYSSIDGYAYVLSPSTEERKQGIGNRKCCSYSCMRKGQRERGII